MRRKKKKRLREGDKGETCTERSKQKAKKTIKDSGGERGRSTLMDYSAFRLLLEAFRNPSTLCLLVW